jgi:hypothetical protein
MSACLPCNKASCRDGFYREVCLEGSDKDAECRLTTTFLAIIIASPVAFVTFTVCVSLAVRRAKKKYDTYIHYIILGFFAAGALGGGFVFLVRSSTSRPVCEPGTFRPYASTTCQTCAPGTFSATEDASACDLCPLGYVNPYSAASTCFACSPGTFAAERGLSACQLCSEGTFAASTNESHCMNCARGKFSTIAGATTCEDCRPGAYSYAEGEDL